MTELVSGYAHSGSDPTYTVVERLEGGLNRTDIVDTGTGRIAIRRPKSQPERAQTERAIEEEYTKIGATALGIGFYLRDLDQQQRFMERAAGVPLQTVRGEVIDDKEMILDYVEGVSLDKYLQQGDIASIDPRVINNVLSHLAHAHSLGIVFGDRWVKNTIIHEDNSHTEIDFDIALRGSHSTVTAFELSQTLFHLLHFASDNRSYVSKVVSGTYINQPELLAGYDKAKIDSFLYGHAEHFSQEYERNGQTYEGLVPPEVDDVKELVADLDIAWDMVPEGPITNSLTAVKEGE